MKDYSNLNRTRGEVLRSMFAAACGLFVFSAGVYLTIQANIGVAPWDVLNQGLAAHTGLMYGTVVMTVSAIVLFVDVLLKEPIGMGMILDTLFVGKSVDLLNWLGLVKLQETFFRGAVCLLAGVVLMALGMRVYMAMGLGCGPRDTLLVALCKRFPKLSIGMLNIAMWAAVTLAGWLLDGQVGAGTVLCIVLMGPVLQTVCTLTHFDAAQVAHQNLWKTIRILAGR